MMKKFFYCILIFISLFLNACTTIQKARTKIEIDSISAIAFDAKNNQVIMLGQQHVFQLKGIYSKKAELEKYKELNPHYFNKFFPKSGDVANNPSWQLETVLQPKFRQYIAHEEMSIDITHKYKGKTIQNSVYYRATFEPNELISEEVAKKLGLEPTNNDKKRKITKEHNQKQYSENGKWYEFLYMGEGDFAVMNNTAEFNEQYRLDKPIKNVDVTYWKEHKVAHYLGWAEVGGLTSSILLLPVLAGVVVVSPVIIMQDVTHGFNK